MDGIDVVIVHYHAARAAARAVEALRQDSARVDLAVNIIIADNGSTDGSQEIAGSLGARLVPVAEPGYGSTLSAGIAPPTVASSSWAIPTTPTTSAT